MTFNQDLSVKIPAKLFFVPLWCEHRLLKNLTWCMKINISGASFLKTSNTRISLCV